MSHLDYRTAGESHGQALIVYVEGMPAGVPLDVGMMNGELKRRQGGYGRGGRQRIEKDKVNLLSGVRREVTIGSPITIQIANKDWRIDEAPEVHRPRPGHADLAGSVKWLTTDCRETLERASARETASRVAAGALAKNILHQFGIQCVGFVTRVGTEAVEIEADRSPEDLIAVRDSNEIYVPVEDAVDPMTEVIRQAKKDKDTVGGFVEVRVFNVPIGIGSCMRWQDKLDGRLLQAVGSIQAFKGAEIGLGFGVGERFGSQVHDEIYYDPKRRDTPSLGFVRKTNNAGGLEGGMTNGQTVIVRGVMKPISTLLRGMDSVNLETKKAERSDYERSDVSAISAASVVAENVVAFEIARAFLEKFGGDTLNEIRAAYDHYLAAARGLGLSPTDE